jgi:hypothetical protein
VWPRACPRNEPGAGRVVSHVLGAVRHIRHHGGASRRRRVQPEKLPCRSCDGNKPTTRCNCFFLLTHLAACRPHTFLNIALRTRTSFCAHPGDRFSAPTFSCPVTKVRQPTPPVPALPLLKHTHTQTEMHALTQASTHLDIAIDRQ